jgi:pimeloyl-ACP methyl ester carboxylesterase
LSDAVLLLHGQPGGARDWDGVLAALGPGLEVIAIDRPGWGDSGSATGLAGNALAALAALDARGVKRATIVGHSLGGGVAAWLGAWYADRVSALVLAAPAANMAALDRFDRLLAAPVIGELATGAALTGVGLALAASPLRERIARALSIDEGYLGLASRRLLTSGTRVAFLTEQRALFRDLPELERRLPEISVPTVIVTGLEDQIVPPDAVRTLAAQIPGARLVELAGAGHLLPQRHAERLARVIEAAAA